jgi:hypothetical protein
MHLLSSEFPRNISTNFWVAPEIKELIGNMYRSEKMASPLLKDAGARPPFYDMPQRTRSDRVAIAYSAGKDSLWNLMRAEEKYGMDNVLVAHIHGLNPGYAHQEFDYVKRQQEKIGFQHLRIIELSNGAGVTGYRVMRSRDMFLAGIIIPVALEFGASKIIIEGFSETGPSEPFSGKESNMVFFNRILKKLGIPVQVDWENREEMDVVKELILGRPEWLAHVCNCFSIPLYRPRIRESWHKNAPSLPLLDSQCGSCVKCRITNLGRVLYDPTMARVRREDIAYFLRTSVSWFKKKQDTHLDMIGGSFKTVLCEALKKYKNGA